MKRAIPQTMRAAVVTKYGPPEVLKIQDMPVPTLEAGEILVQTKAIGLNFAEVFARLGYYPSVPKPPFVPGIEFAGIVRAVEQSVRGMKVGDRVFGFSKQGAYAEYIAIPGYYAVHIPRTMSFEEAAASVVAPMTAYHGLVTLAHLQKGERLLIHAAAGGVGTIAVQIARHLGAETFATVGSDSKKKIVEDLGAAVVVNYSRDNFADIIRRETGDAGVDVVFDSVGGRLMRPGLRLLAPMGRYVLYGFASVAGERRVSKVKAIREVLSVPLIYPPSLVTKNISLMGFNLYFVTKKSTLMRKTMEQLMRWHERGVFRPILGAVYPFEQIADAQAFLQSRKSVGKVVVSLR